MASLRAKDAYLQGLARKICAQPGPEPRERRSAGKTRGSVTAGPPSKKRKKTLKRSQEQKEKAAESKAHPQGKKSPGTSGAKSPVAAKQEQVSLSKTTSAGGPDAEQESLFALDILRQRLHDKIQEARGQGGTKELSAATLEKRRKRKLERERKKRKRKELRAKEKAAKAGEVAETPQPPSEAPGKEAQPQAELLFNKVEVGGDEPLSKAQRRKEKRQKLKGNLTPLTGKNYRQLLERLHARQDQLEELRERDGARAQELEAKMRWTNLLYKAEGVKIRDDERRLQEALKRKEQRRAQRRRGWERRAAHVVEKMQRRQDRRRQNLRQKKAQRAERRLEKARKKGRVLPGDLERAGLA